MSLGVRHLWRSWRHASLAPRVSSLIPRERPFAVRTSLASAFTAHSFSTSRCLSISEIASSIDTQVSNGEATRTCSDSPGLPATEVESFNNELDSFSEELLARSRMFIDRLSEVPVRALHSPGAVVEPMNDYPHHRERIRDWRKHRKSLRRYLYHRKRSQKIAPDGRTEDWRAVLKTLVATTPSYSPVVGVVQVIIPESSAPRLTGNPLTDVWAIASSSGCAMLLHEGNPDDPQDDTYLLLSGEKTAVNRAVKGITDLGRQIRVIHLTKHDAEMLQKAALPVLWRRDFVVHMRYFLHKKLSEIKKPREWTPVTFERYIAALVKSRLPSGLYYELGEGNAHSRRVVEAVYDAFRDPAARFALSITSFKLALRYIVSFGTGYWSFAHALFDMMRSLGHEIDTEVYDILSLAALKVNNLGFFHSFVIQMGRNGLAPSFQTWMHFLRLVKSEEVRRYILHAMAAKGLFSHPTAMYHLATELSGDDTHRAIEMGLDLESFVASQNEVYGPQWLHWHSANQVLEVLGCYGRFDDMGKFLDIMFQKDLARPVNEIALNIILTHCQTQRELDVAIGYVKRFEDELGRLRADGITFHLLCDLAWRMKRPHMFSVLLRYAFVTKLTPRRAKLRAAALLASDDLPNGNRTRWFLSRLKIAGVLPMPPKGQPDPYSGGGRRRESNLALLLSMQNFLLSEYKKAHEIKSRDLLTDGQVEEALNLFYRNAFRNKEPVDRLGLLLDVALEEDRRLRKESLQGKPVALKPIQIELRMRRKSTPLRPDDYENPRDSLPPFSPNDLESTTETNANSSSSSSSSGDQSKADDESEQQHGEKPEQQEKKPLVRRIWSQGRGYLWQGQVGEFLGGAVLKSNDSNEGETRLDIEKEIEMSLEEKFWKLWNEVE